MNFQTLIFYVSFLLGGLWLFGSSIPMKNHGELFGILESKGEAWIEVKEDNGFRDRYLAPWKGGSPSTGGGFDPEILKIIKSCPVGNRVHLKWRHDGHLRVEEMALIAPRERQGVFTGKLIEIGDRWVEFENPEDRVPWRFYLRWIGGYPENGGGYDGKSRQELVARSDEPLFRFRWSYDVRPRFENLLELENKKTPVFYHSKDTPPPTEENRTPNEPKQVNPFDSVSPKQVNPFDSVSPQQVNPFELKLTPKTNPFDMAPAPQSNPFQGKKASQVNPFDLAPNPTQINPTQNQNPFDLNTGVQGTKPPTSAPSKGNPFDQIPRQK